MRKMSIAKLCFCLLRQVISILPMSLKVRQSSFEERNSLVPSTVEMKTCFVRCMDSLKALWVGSSRQAAEQADTQTAVDIVGAVDSTAVAALNRNEQSQ